jgi:hypothetical protein
MHAAKREDKMATATAGNDDLEHLRVIVYPDGDLFIAQCLEKDIATQARDIPTLLERLDLTIDAECAMSRDRNETPFSQIGAAPNYFHDLWEKRSVMPDSLARSRRSSQNGGRTGSAVSSISWWLFRSADIRH